MNTEIKTSRLLLRQFKESDFDDLLEFLSQLENDEFEGYPGISYENGRKNLTERLGSTEYYAVELKLCFPGAHVILTIPESPMFNAPEATVNTEPRLALVKQAGKQYAESGKIDALLLDEICSPMIPEEQYAAIVNGEV